MKRFSLVLISVCLIMACQNEKPDLIVESPVDSLMLNWTSNWNNHDSVALMQMFDEEAVLFDNNIITRNPDELWTKLIQPYHDILINMKTEKIQEWVIENRAGTSGTWAVDIIVNDTTLKPTKGAYTIVWKRLESGEWKVTNAHINDFTK